MNATQQHVQFIQNALDKGFSQKQIADALGCTEAYVSQLCAEHDLQPSAQLRFTKHDDLYEQTELLALQRLKNTIQFEPGLNAVALARIAATLNGTKRRSQTETPVQAQQTVVTLQLPVNIAAQFVFNGNNEAVAVQSSEGTRILATASSKQVAAMAAQALPKIGGTHHGQAIATEDL